MNRTKRFRIFRAGAQPPQQAAEGPSGGPDGSSFSLFQVKARKKEVKKLRFFLAVPKNYEPLGRSSTVL